jgi:hypothetical protein
MPPCVVCRARRVRAERYRHSHAKREKRLFDIAACQSPVIEQRPHHGHVAPPHGQSEGRHAGVARGLAHLLVRKHRQEQHKHFRLTHVARLQECCVANTQRTTTDQMDLLRPTQVVYCMVSDSYVPVLFLWLVAWRSSCLLASVLQRARRYPIRPACLR